MGSEVTSVLATVAVSQYTMAKRENIQHKKTVNII